METTYKLDAPLLRDAKTMAEFTEQYNQFIVHYCHCLKTPPIKVELAPKILESVDMGDHTREKIQISVEEGEPPLNLYLLLPKDVQDSTPAVLCIHQHAGEFNLGKSETAGLFGSKLQPTALELVRKGYVTIAPDSRCFEESRKYWDGDSIYGYERLVKGYTLAGTYVNDQQRVLDYLCSRTEVDADRIACIGHSGGAIQSALLLPLESRIKVAVLSQGASLYEEMLKRGDSFNQAWVLPDFYTKADMDALYSCFAPKPLLLLGREQDGVSNLADQLKIEAVLNKNYALHGVEEKFSYCREPGTHAFSDELRALAYDWIDRWL